MDDALRNRIVEKLERLPDEKALQVLDYVAFLESRYNMSERTRSTLGRIVAGVEDTLRAGRVPAAALKGTITAMDAAGRVMRGLAAAGRVVAEEIEGGKEGGTAGPADNRQAGDERAEAAPVESEGGTLDPPGRPE